MRIGIEINGVLRDTIGKLSQVYEKKLIGINDNDLTTEVFELGATGNTEVIVTSSKFEYSINYPIDSLDLSKHFSFPNKEELFSFLYEDCPMEIFGHAMSSEMLTFNYLNDFYKEFRNEHDIVIISDEIGKSKPATLFFLSKFSSLPEEIIFYNDKTKNNVLSKFDLIVTSNPNMIIDYRNKCHVIKYITDYNSNVQHYLEINSLSEISEVVKKIKK